MLSSYLYSVLRFHLLVGLFVSSSLLSYIMPTSKTTPTTAWKSLTKGNDKFVRDTKMSKQRARIPEVQSPTYIVLSCSDSRVTPEYIFKQPLGNFFVVRVAGNVVDALVIDSIEFAIRNFHSSVIVILGHSQCGAVIGALDHLKKNNGKIGTPHDLYAAVLTPIEKTIVKSAIDIKSPDALDLAIKANVRHSADLLMASSPLIDEGVKKGTLSIIGAEYTLATGKITELFLMDSAKENSNPKV